MMGAKVNNKIVNLEYQLQSGDVVEVLTGNTNGPGRDWMKMAKTNEARNKIKQWFKKEKYEENIGLGKSTFNQELKRAGIAVQTILHNDVLPAALKQMSFLSIDDMYAAIGYGGMSSTRAINRFRDVLLRLNRQREKVVEKPDKPKKLKRPISGVIVEELDNCLIKFSRCCAPVPGDTIIGFVTRGFGVSIHRDDCPSALQMRRSQDQGRWVEVFWADDINETYNTDLTVTAFDRGNLLVDMMATLSSARIPISSLTAKAMSNGTAIVKLTAEVSGVGQINALRSDLVRVSGVKSVKRE
jgi:GTP pyrophosphokinase